MPISVPQLLSFQQSITDRHTHLEWVPCHVLPLQLVVARLESTWTVHGVAMPHVLATQTTQAIFDMRAGRSHF